MAYASNSLTRIGMVKETVFGVTPTTPTLIAQRYSSASFTYTSDELLDDSKTGSREYTYTQRGNSAVTGTIDGSLAYDNYDRLFESVMYNTWTANTLVLGNTRQSYTIEEAQPDVGVYRVIRGAQANGFTLETSVDGNATISFDMLAKSMTNGSASLDADGYTAQPVAQPFRHCGGLVSEGGAPLAAVSSISLAVSNGLSPLYVWGDCDTTDLIADRFDVTGTLVVYFSDVTLMNKFIAGTESSLSFTLEDAEGDTLTFDMQNIKYTGADTPIETGSGQRIITLPFRALRDSVTGTTLTITRSA